MIQMISAASYCSFRALTAMRHALATRGQAPSKGGQHINCLFRAVLILNSVYYEGTPSAKNCLKTLRNRPFDGPGAAAESAYFAGGFVFYGAVDLIVAACCGFDGDGAAGGGGGGVDPDAPVGGQAVLGGVFEFQGAFALGVGQHEGGGNGIDGKGFPAMLAGHFHG